MSRLRSPRLSHPPSPQYMHPVFMYSCRCVRFISVFRRAGSVWQNHPPFYGTWQSLCVTDSRDTAWIWITVVLSAGTEARVTVKMHVVYQVWAEKEGECFPLCVWCPSRKLEVFIVTEEIRVNTLAGRICRKATHALCDVTKGICDKWALMFLQQNSENISVRRCGMYMYAC